MSRHDPTDDVLAAIASIFDKSEPAPPPPAIVPHQDSPETHETVDLKPIEEEAAAPAVAEAPVPQGALDGYSRVGPGPLDALRFRWTARRTEQGQYFVDETIGTQSRAVSRGPMAEGDVMTFINAREHETRKRLDKLKDEMTLRRDTPAKAGNPDEPAPQTSAEP